MRTIRLDQWHSYYDNTSLIQARVYVCAKVEKGRYQSGLMFNAAD